MFEKVIEVGILFDFYGKLLSEKQYTAIELYYIHDLSLSEIGEHLNISRQGVHDTLKRAENKLYSYEETLGLVKKFNENRRKIKDILEVVKEIEVESRILNSKNIKRNIEKVEEIITDILEISQEGK
ncbi:YlxM family DNA-binding protein [Gottschalkia purinilytica]|nr:YlxM family DNA-binding protein [Gottschalkia purinilytica]